MKSVIPENTAHFSLGEIARVTLGTLTSETAKNLSIEGVTTDSRNAVSGKLFVALSGEHFDGHLFASQAVRKGARALLVERDLGEVGIPAVRVASTRLALLALAGYHRRRWAGRLVAVAGSAGKTTTRFAVGVALSALAPGEVHSVPGNLNNAIGLSLVLLGLEAQHRFAVAEIGTNAPGEVRSLSLAAEPDLGIVTLIGLEHTQGLGRLEEVEREEGSLFEALLREAAALGNGDDPRVLRQLERAQGRVRLRYGFGEGLEYRILERSLGQLGPSRIRLGRPGRDELILTCPLLGRPGAYALAAGVAAAETLSGEALSAARLDAAFAGVEVGEPGRLVPILLGNGAVLIDDTYNSNPASMPSSVGAAAEIARARVGRLWLVLGEMRELGEDSPRLHRETGEKLVDFGAVRVLAVGGDARWLLEPFERAQVATAFLPDAEQARECLAGQLSSGDVVLVKASRGVHAERIVDALIQEYGRAP